MTVEAHPRRGFSERLRGNPVVLKELRGRMRGPRAFAVMTVYLGLTSGLTVLLYVLQAEAINRTSTPTGSDIGRVLFYGVVAIELFLVTFIGPAFTASAISGEREHRTYELLRTTLLSASALMFGKLVSALSYIVLLLFAAIPLQAIAFLFGGVSVEELVLSLVILLATALQFGTVGLYFSAIMDRTLPASVLTYSYALFTTVGLPIFLAIFLPIFSPLVRLINSSAVQAAALYASGIVVSTNPIATMLITQTFIAERQEIGAFQFTLATGQQVPVISPWIPYTIFAVLTSVVLMWLTVQRIRQQADE
ncbi:MAG: ABC transporter permease [Anaerolineae bacterium]|nr:ABC transporter permease [Anaerolineae bacterium]